MIEVKIVPNLQMGTSLYFFFEMPESDTAPRGAYERLTTVLTSLNPRKDVRGLKPVELDTILAAVAGHYKIVPGVQIGERLFHARGTLKI
jgi:hypothetical protein